MDNGKRLCIYFFYDADGVADRYVDFYVQALRRVSDRLVVISNGPLTEASRALLLRHTPEVWERENVGLDVWAYKTAMERIGWDELRQYHELVLANSTLMGPVYPFEEMFEAMARQEDLDFWGLSAFGELEDDPFGANPYGYLPEHIQSHFTVYRNRFLQAEQLKRYWDDMPMIESYEQSIGRHESYFTKYFADRGFHWDVYIHSPEPDYSNYYLMMDPVRAIREDRCPVFKRRSFFQKSVHYLTESAGEQPWELYQYLKNHTAYDTDMILENLIRTCHQDDFVRTLRLSYVLPSTDLLTEKTRPQSVAAVFHLFYMDLLPDSLHYASALPEDVDLYITTPEAENEAAIREVFSVLPNRLEIRIIENRGRDVSALLVGAADLQEKYELICFYHDKKSSQAKPHTIGRSFSYKAAESALSSRTYVENLLTTFARNPRLGMLSATVPNHALFLDTLSYEWGRNYKNARSLARELGLSAPMGLGHNPVAPLGTIFWYRTAALKPLFDHGWQYEDFPPEPNATDGTLLHAIERLYPMVVQSAGYYPGRVMPEHLAALDLSNLSFYVTEYNRIRLVNGIYGTFPEALDLMDKRLSKRRLPLWVYKALKKTRLFLKRKLSPSAYVAILKAKRAVFGPHQAPKEADEED